MAESLKREQLVEVMFDTCGAYKKGDVTYGQNLSASEEGFKYLVDNGVVVASKEKAEKLYSVSASVSPAEFQAMEEQVEILTDQVEKLTTEKTVWEAIAADPGVAKAIAEIKKS